MADSSKSGNEGSPRTPTTKELMNVSRKLSTDWKMFVREIDVPDSEIDAIVEKHRFEPLEQKYQCLCYWLNDKGDQASLKQLIDAAKKSGQVKLAKDIETISTQDVLGSHHEAIESLQKTVLQRKRDRSSSLSSEECELQQYHVRKRLQDYMEMKMDLLDKDISDLHSEADPDEIIKLLYINAFHVISELLEPHLEEVKKAADRYCQLDLHQTKLKMGETASAASIEGLLNQMSVTGKWDNTRFLRKAVHAIPRSAPERGVAEAILSHYNLHLEFYERATLLKERLAKRKESENPKEDGGQTKLVPLEVTVPKDFSAITCEDCHRLQVRVLSTAYGIPEESIVCCNAEKRCSTTITFLIPSQYSVAILQHNTQLDTVWVLLELDVIEVAIPELFSFKPSVDYFLKLLRESRTFTVDLLRVTKVLPYQVYVLLDSDVEPLTLFGQTDPRKMASTWDVSVSLKSSMVINDREYVDAEPPDSSLPVSSVSNLPEYVEPESRTASTYEYSATEFADEPSKKEAPHFSSEVRKSQTSQTKPEYVEPESRTASTYEHSATESADEPPRRKASQTSQTKPEYVEPESRTASTYEYSATESADEPPRRKASQTSQIKLGLPVECTDDVETAITGSVHHQLATRVPSYHEQMSETTEESEQDNRHQYTGGCKEKRRDDESQAMQSLPSLSSDQDTSDAELCRVIHSSHAPHQKPSLDLWKFTAYTWVHKFCSYITLTAIALTTLMCEQIFLVSVDCYESYNIRSEHSQCSCSFPYPWLGTAALRITSRFAFPLLLSIVFWRQVVCRKAAALEGQAGSTKESFAAEIKKRHNHGIVKELVRKFWNKSVKPTDDAIVLLNRIRDELDHELTSMCFTSLVQPFVLIIAFFTFNLVDAHSGVWQGSSYWLGVADILSFGIVTAVSGVMLSFYFLESKIKHYVRTVHTLLNTNRTLRDKAKETEHIITKRWYPLEIGMRFVSVIIPTILLMSWASDIPLSCGFSVSIEAITKQSAAACWMGFIVVVTVGQVMVTSPFYPLYLRCSGLIMEVIFLFIFYITFPTNEWMQLTHVLYAIVPLSYLIWYHIASICRQWLAINKTTEGNPTYVSRLASRTGLFILIMATLAASLYVEYSHLHPSAIGKYSRADNIAQLAVINQWSHQQHATCTADHEKAILQQLAYKTVQ